MAIATLISRITGFLRTVLIGAALGPAIASAFNIANTLPNLITELVLGAVLTSLVVPVLVRAEKEDPDRGAAFIRRLFTITVALMGTITVLSVAAAPLLVDVQLSEAGQVNVSMTKAFAFLVLPQIVFYAMFAVFMAVLNTKGIFKPGAWAPVVNNVVTLSVLSLYYLLPDDLTLKPTDNVTIVDPSILLLGLGTTAGVVMQALIMIPYLRKAGIDLRPLWGIDERLKSFGGMAIAIIVYVAISQVGWTINNRIADSASPEAPGIYMMAWQLLQVPYGVIGVTLLTAVMPRLSRNAAEGDDKAVVGDLTVATKLTLLALIPVIVFFTAFGTLISGALFLYGQYTLEASNVLGWTISFSAFTLIPYAIVLLHLRVFYAREEVWTPTFIIAGITITKLALASVAPHIATEPRLVVVLLGAANGFGFVAGAIIGDRLLRRSLGSLNTRAVLKTSAWALGSSLLGALVAWRLDLLLLKFVFKSVESPWFLLRMLVAGIVFLLVTGAALSRSGLPEVLTVGRALSRLPVVGRFFSGRQPEDEELSTDEHSMQPQRATAEYAAREAAVANALLPALPPLSAGVVRGPRLVPGAPIMDGRFRLLADHGGSPAARLWQARDVASKEVVALTIMDPNAAVRAEYGSAPVIPDRARKVIAARREIVRRSQALMDCTGPGLARIRQVVESPTTVIVISDWVAGSPLSAVAESGPDPMAAGYAVSDLSFAVARAHNHGAIMGLDHRDRIRISTEGAAVLAFPGVLPKNSEIQDIRGIGVVLDLLLKQIPESEIPQDLMEAMEDIKHEADDVDPSALGKHLRALTTGEMTVDADETPDPTSRSGFGAAQNKPRSFATAGLLAFAVVVLIAAVVAALVSQLGGSRVDNPLTPDSIRDGAANAAGQKPAQVQLKNAVEWTPSDGRGTPDSPEDAKNIADGNPATTWKSDEYSNPLGPSGLKDGIGLMISLPEGTNLTQVQLQGLVPGMKIELRSANGDVTSLQDTQLLDTLDVKKSAETVTLETDTPHAEAEKRESTSTQAAAPSEQPGKDNEVKGNRLLLWITALPTPNLGSISEVTAMGTWKGQPEADTQRRPEQGAGDTASATTAPAPAPAR